MNIDEAARATRKFIALQNMAAGFVVLELGAEDLVKAFANLTEAQASCDRLNLLAVLEAIREPSDSSLAYVAPEEDAAKAHWINMIDALIAEVKAQK